MQLHYLQIHAKGFRGVGLGGQDFFEKNYLKIFFFFFFPKSRLLKEIGVRLNLILKKGRLKMKMFSQKGPF